MALLSFRKEGIYCKQADVYIDPTRSVKRALITHGHSDHARKGMNAYLCSSDSVGILHRRLGKNINIKGVDFGQKTTINGVSISFHPAGHVLGSAQIRLEYKGEIWVATGDYKIVDDGISTPFESIKCDHFITETTFGLPIYQWQDQQSVFESINLWWSQNSSNNRTSIIHAYSLGKAQRILHGLDKTIGDVYVHPSIAGHNEDYENRGRSLGKYQVLHDGLTKKDLEKSMIIGSPTIVQDHINIQEASFASASGWNQFKRGRRGGQHDRAFVLSDHADWNGINEAIKNSGAENIYVTHGYTQPMKEWLDHKGYNAIIVKNEEDEWF